ncbi:beta-microseminoprotein A1-like [Monodelphis domestica]|uniref:beta-microseminoprotein A1-like n=1 Tax=Monodelphis domestica TaxID=13616 RepID=UPI0024E2763F|nr:beta-microseminoprotein A1-like [Monodelphis domestica]
MKINGGNESEGCTDGQGVFHYLYSTWSDDECETCDCLENGIECCNIIMRPIGYDEEKCEEFLDKKLCLYRAVEKENHTQLCEISEYII